MTPFFQPTYMLQYNHSFHPRVIHRPGAVDIFVVDNLNDGCGPRRRFLAPDCSDVFDMLDDLEDGV